MNKKLEFELLRDAIVKAKEQDPAEGISDVLTALSNYLSYEGLDLESHAILDLLESVGEPSLHGVDRDEEWDLKVLTDSIKTWDAERSKRDRRIEDILENLTFLLEHKDPVAGKKIHDIITYLRIRLGT